nr:JmjC domain-containing protein [Tanacetum cinerariifolium]
MLSDSEGEEAATKEQDINLDALYRLANTSLGSDSTVEAAYTIYKASHDAHASSDAGHDADAVPDDTTMPFRHTIPVGGGVPADAQTIPTGGTPIPSSEGVSAGSSMDHAGQAAAAAPSSSIPAADKGKSFMVDDSLPTDLLTEQERILKNLHDYQLGEDLAKKLHAKQEAEFARQQEELAQKAQAESVTSPIEQGTGLSAQRRRELDAAQQIYTKADWLELMAKITTNTALSKQLLGDDVNEDNMNERLGMLLMRKQWELAEQSRVKPMNKTQQQDFMRDFMKNQSASVYNQGWTMKQVKALSLAQLKHEFEYIQRTLERSNLLNFKRTTFRPTPTLEAPFAKRARQWVPQDVHVASSQVPAGVSAASSIAADVSVLAASSIAADVSVSAVPSVYADTEYMLMSLGHTKHFTSLRELLHMVEKNDLRKLMGDVDNLYEKEEPDIFALILWGDLRVHVLETVDVWVIYMFVVVSYPLSAATLKRILKHRLEVPKLLVGGDLTMAKYSPWLTAKKELTHHEGTALLASPEQTATGKDVPNPFMAMMVCQKPFGYFSSPMIHVLRAGLVINPPG